jgi:hypothetical protein
MNGGTFRCEARRAFHRPASDTGMVCERPIDGQGAPELPGGGTFKSMEVKAALPSVLYRIIEMEVSVKMLFGGFFSSISGETVWRYP